MLAFSRARRAARAAALAGVTAVLSAGLVTVAAPTYAAVPKTPRFGAAIENLSPYQPQTRCHPVAQKGVLKFRALILATYHGTGDDGIVRGCKVGGTSEHKEGRAWDWMVSAKNAHQVAQVRALFTWLFASDRYGNRYAMARRLGVMYIIWNKKIWGSYRAAAGWRRYSCSGVTGCHQNHVHFSFSRAGAKGVTSYWTKVVVNVGGTPGNGSGTPRPQPTPTPTQTPVPVPAPTDGTSGGGVDDASVPPTPAETALTIAAPATAAANEAFSVTGQLTTAAGDAVADQVVHIYGRLDSSSWWQHVTDVVTDEDGGYRVELRTPAAAQLRARFSGTDELLGARSDIVDVAVTDAVAASTDGSGGGDGY